MSIVTLKKKTQSKYQTMSVAQTQFSLQGTHRSMGYIGQTSLSRSLPLTRYRGMVPIGHGGFLGEYHQTTNVTYGTGTNTTNDSSIIKSSVVSTDGMLAQKYPWYRAHYTYKDLPSHTSYQTYLDKKQTTCSQLSSTFIDPCSRTTKPLTCVSNPWMMKRHYQANTTDRAIDMPIAVQSMETKTYTHDYLPTRKSSCVSLTKSFPRMSATTSLPSSS